VAKDTLGYAAQLNAVLIGLRARQKQLSLQGIAIAGTAESKSQKEDPGHPPTSHCLEHRKAMSRVAVAISRMLLP
jgi:hypothetical protein